MADQKILFICGSLNQTTMMGQIAEHLPDYSCYFTPYYCDGLLRWLHRAGWLNFTIMGGAFRKATENYLVQHRLPLDYEGRAHDYDLVVTCTDLLVQRNIQRKKIVLVQEGMTDSENLLYYLVKWFGLPRFLASTAANGLSDAYVKFCVASDGYRELFVCKGVNPEKIAVTGIPNYDNARRLLHNDFPLRHYVLVATSDARETFKFDNRRQFIQKAVAIANGRPLLFKLHPNEKVARAVREITRYAPQALIYTSGDIDPMIANCDVLITQYSTVAYLGLALGKEVYSYFDLDLLRKLTPIQNGGRSAAHIAAVCQSILEGRGEATWEAMTLSAPHPPRVASPSPIT